jgi:hypothetical protein
MSYRNGLAFSCPANVAHLRPHCHDIPFHHKSYKARTYLSCIMTNVLVRILASTLHIPVQIPSSGGSCRVQQLESEGRADCYSNVCSVLLSGFSAIQDHL